MKKKYIPSIKANNQLKEKAVNELKGVIYRLEHGKYESEADSEAVSRIADELKYDTEALQNTVGTGDENVFGVYEKIVELTKELKKQADQNMLHRIDEAASDLDFYINLWKDALDGSTAIPTEEAIRAAKISFSRRRLNARLAELSDIKDNFSQSAKRIEKDISAFEKDLAELDDAILREDNERKINEYFKKISAYKTKIDSLTVRKDNYDTCFNLLDMIYVNANEIVEASDFAGEEIGKAKALLNIGKLKKVLSEPDKALRILKRMQADIQEVYARTKSMDEKLSSVSTQSTVINGDAMAYKEELMKKKRDMKMASEALGATNTNTETSKVRSEEEN